MTAAVELEAVHRSYGPIAVLRGLDLTVEKGSLTAVLGPSGSGKTTLLRVIAGFARADSGRVVLDGRPVDEGASFVAAEKRGLGYVAQEGALFPHLDVAGNVGFGIRGRGARRARVEEMLEMVGMSEFRERHPAELSGGQQQRVALARALAVRPQVMLLDEPFTGLDPALRATVRAEVSDIIRHSGTTAILVTHDQDEALSMADEVAVLRDGVVLQHGPPHELYSRPVDAALARFLGDANLVPAVVADGQAVTVLGRLPVRERDGWLGPGLALVRPEQLRLNACDVPGLLGVVVDSEYYGHDAVVHIRPDDPLDDERTLIARLHGTQPPSRGTRVSVTVEGTALVFPIGP
jgi:iron(III) transport system ATP-binding protein